MEIDAPTTKEWRAWLEKNHEKESEVWILVHKRHTGKPAMTHRESMEEAICFGWIDTIIKSVDENTFKRCFRKRGPNANWSVNTLSYAKQLTKNGRMAPQGLKRYKEGLKKKPLDSYIPKNPGKIPELQEALSKDPVAKKNFNNFPPSTKKMFRRWILSAKTQPTIEKRINAVVEKAKKNEKKW